MALLTGRMLLLAFITMKPVAAMLKLLKCSSQLPSTTADIGELMSRQHAQQKLDSHHSLHEIFMSVRYLCQQGLPLRRDREEKDGDLNQLLYMKAEEDEILANWLKKKKNVYTSPTIHD